MSLAGSFCDSGFARMINSPGGRIARIAAGLALIGWGFSLRGTTPGIVLMAAGLIPLATGSFDWCLISAILGGPLSGAEIRGRKP